MKKPKAPRDYTARVAIYGLESGGAGYVVHVSKWLQQLAADLRKSAKKQLKTRKVEYSDTFTAKLFL